MRRRKILLLAGVFALIVTVGARLIFSKPMGDWWSKGIAPLKVALAPRPVPDAKTYEVLRMDLEQWREDLAQRYGKAKTVAERETIEADARIILEQTLPAMMRCWLGTPWDFDGTAEGPGKGKIACGYFVATVLKDAGFRVDRYRLAQQPSENIMRTFVAKDSCSLTVGRTYDAFAKDLADVRPGIYLIGLDTHVGFLIVAADGFRMIHSSGSSPWCVVDEGREDANVLRKSNWRMLGNFTGDAGMVKSWLKGDKIAVRGT